MKKEVREGYKMTELGEIPEEWNFYDLGNVVKFQGGSQPPKKYFSNECLDGMIRLIQIRDYKNDNFKVYVPKEMCRRFCSKDDIMIGRYGPPIFQILRGLEGAYNVALIKAIPVNKNLNKEYLYYFLNNEKLFKLIDSLSQRTSGQTGIDMDVLKEYKMPLPPYDEQEKIVSILSTVDEQIDNVDALIEKNKELKKGLMQTLLTKGIGHTKFKKTEIGEIPEEWEVKSIADIANTTSGGTPSRAKKEYYENGIYPWVKTGELNNKYISVTEEYITEDALKKSSAKLVPINTVIIAMYGATIGKLSIAKRDVTTNQACCSIICDKSICYNEYLYYRLDFEKENIINLGAGGAQPNISQDIIKNYKIALPGMHEQKKIASILSEVDNKIEEYEDKREKLEELKKGLMQQLLTGKIRVN